MFVILEKFDCPATGDVPQPEAKFSVQHESGAVLVIFSVFPEIFRLKLQMPSLGNVTHVFFDKNFDLYHVKSKLWVKRLRCLEKISAPSHKYFFS